MRYLCSELGAEQRRERRKSATDKSLSLVKVKTTGRVTSALRTSHVIHLCFAISSNTLSFDVIWCNAVGCGVI
jgi:hypothetical protein